MGAAMLSSVLTTDHPAISAVALYTSMTACTCSFLISTRCVSPTKPGVDCMVTCICSGPTEAREAATVTFTFVGNRAMASLAVPVNTVRCSFCKDSSYTAVPRRALGPFSLKKRAVAPPHEGGRLQYIEAACGS